MAKEKVVGSTMFARLDGKVVEIKIKKMFKSKGKSATELCIIQKLSGGPEIQIEKARLIENSPLLAAEQSGKEKELLKEIAQKDEAGIALAADLETANNKILELEEIINEGSKENLTQAEEITKLKAEVETLKK
ncbi:hypothetical protein KAR91_31250 [Candidatus Pacearchaeota archaeon]|nr:hypothetical protein [Candidatus Pacearchaeota archaeon]